MPLTTDRSDEREAPQAMPSLPFDVKKAMIGGVAAELHRTRGGNDLLNWLEAERLVLSLLSRGAGSNTPRPLNAQGSSNPRPNTSTTQPREEADACRSTPMTPIPSSAACPGRDSIVQSTGTRPDNQPGPDAEPLDAVCWLGIKSFRYHSAHRR